MSQSSAIEEYNSDSSDILSEDSFNSMVDEKVSKITEAHIANSFKEKKAFSFPMKQGEPNDIVNGFVFDLRRD